MDHAKMQSNALGKNVKDKPTSTGGWVETTMGLLYVNDGSVQFYDDHDHWKQAFCRLLEIDEKKARAYVERTVELAKSKFGEQLRDLPPNKQFDCLKQATDEILYGGTRPDAGSQELVVGPQGQKPNIVYAQSVSGDKSRSVIGNKDLEFAWLVNTKDNQLVTADSIVYDNAYFGSEGTAHYGMKHYSVQMDWRLEKSRRLINTTVENAGWRRDKWLSKPAEVKMLDVGSGIGYFRKAVHDLGFQHFGIDLSTDIIAQCKEVFGFDTWNCRVENLDSVAKGMKFQLITMWDVIEHLEFADEVVGILKQYLADDGVIVVRTPNLSAIEADILGDYYYSFKFDHVRYFSPKSLADLMSKQGLKPVYVETASHLFKGIFGPEYLYQIGMDLRGADILALYANESSK